MKYDILAKSIKQIISKRTLKNLSQFSNDGDDLLLNGDLHIDLLDKFEILNEIEEKHNILVNDENLIWNNDLTIGQYISEIFNQIHK